MNALNQEQVLDIFKDVGGILKGHFLLTSGLHSDTYMQCALALQYPDKAEMLCRSLAGHFDAQMIDVVVGPAMGGIVVAQEVGRVLGRRTIFTERKEGVMVLRRGFSIKPGEKILVVEDVTTTGGSVKEVITLLKGLGGNVQAVAALVDRSGGTIDFGVPYTSLMMMEVKTYAPEMCPLCAAGTAAVKPGSR